MELDELKTMWSAHETKLEKSATLNINTLDNLISQKVKSTVKPLLIQNSVVLALHALTIVALVVFLWFNFSLLPYAVSALVLLGYYSVLFVNTFRQIIVIKSINSNSDLISMQRSLAKLKTYILDFIRLSVLTIPAFLSFPVVIPKALADLNINIFNDFDIIRQTNGSWWLAEIVTFVILIPLGIWFYKQVNPQNIHKKWVRHIINLTTNKSVAKAANYLNELEEMKSVVI